MWCVKFTFETILTEISQNLRFPHFPLFQIFAQHTFVTNATNCVGVVVFLLRFVFHKNYRFDQSFSRSRVSKNKTRLIQIKGDHRRLSTELPISNNFQRNSDICQINHGSFIPFICKLCLHISVNIVAHPFVTSSLLFLFQTSSQAPRCASSKADKL